MAAIQSAVGRSISFILVVTIALAAFALSPSPASAQVPSQQAIAVTTGFLHTCALTTDRTIRCWGETDFGISSPPNGQFTIVSAGSNFTCAIATDGTLNCWGLGSFGETNPPSGTFTAVSGGLFHACAIATDQSVHCWGSNSVGQRNAPAGTYNAVSAGGDFACAIRATDDTVKCWGDPADGRTHPPDGMFEAISAGGGHVCGIAWDSTLVCWGYNGDGQASPPPGTFTAVSAGDDHTCALSTDNTIVCWGADGALQGTGLPGAFTSVSAGAHYNCAIAPGGVVSCWGDNFLGQLGSPPLGPSPAPTNSLVAMPYTHTFTSSTGAPTGIFTLGAGTLPPGLALSTAGVLSGTPSVAGTFTFTVKATNLQGTASAQFAVTIADDTQPPQVVITPQAPNFGSPNGSNGWFTSGPVSGSVTAADAGTGGSIITSIDCTTVANGGSAQPLALTDVVGLGTSSTARGTWSVSAEGAIVVSCTATDARSNTSAAVTRVVKIDTAAPTVSCPSPPQFQLNQAGASVTATVTDAQPGSGASSPTASGHADTLAAGTFSVHLTGTDNAGNATSVDCPYTVVEQLGFLGFEAPLPKTKLVSSNATVPVKFRLGGSSGNPLSDDTASQMQTKVTLSAAADGSNPVAQVACAYNATNHVFQCNLKIPKGVSLYPFPYYVTAYELVGGSYVKASPSSSSTTPNPEVVYFK